MRLLCLACWLLCVVPLGRLAAQSYTPKQIRFEGGSGDQAALLRLTGLKPGVALTKAEIDTALAKLADSGAFTELSYTVDADALVIKLGAAAADGQALPVRYVNLVWWPADELTRLLEQRVPLFHGELPLSGTLTDQVRTALVSLLAEKGVANAKVEAMPSTLSGTRAGLGAIALNVTQPEIVLGKLQISGAAAITQRQLDVVTGKLSLQEFESDVTPRAIHDNVLDTEKNAGYLDAVVDPPVFSAPRRDMNGYALDATAAVRPGEMYRIGAVDYAPTPPLDEAESEKAAALKAGDPAGAMVLSVAAGSLQRAYRTRGYMDAVVKAVITLNRVAHTASLRFTTEPGELYHLAAVDTNALPRVLQAAFAREFRGTLGMDAGVPLNVELVRSLKAIHAPSTTNVEMRGNPAQHTVILVLSPERTPAITPRQPGS